MPAPMPRGLRVRGKRLWTGLNEGVTLDAAQVEIATEACRIADRLEQLNDVITGKGVLRLMHFRSMFQLDDGDTRNIVLTVDGALSEARQQANVLKQLLAALRLPDEAGNRPQQRGGARGSYGKGVGTSPAPAPDPDGVVTPFERARQAATGP